MTPDELEVIEKQSEKWNDIIIHNAYENYGQGLSENLDLLDEALNLLSPTIKEVKRCWVEIQRLQTENEALNAHRKLSLELVSSLNKTVGYLDKENSRLIEQLKADPLAKVPKFDWGEGEPEGKPIEHVTVSNDGKKMFYVQGDEIKEIDLDAATKNDPGARAYFGLDDG